MDSITITQEGAKELLEAQAHIWSHILHYLNSMALKCALELNIFDTIHKNGKPMTLNELATSLPIDPNKSHSLNRLMRLLVSSNFFSMEILKNGELGFTLTLSSKLLLKEHPFSQAPFALTLLDPIMTEPSHTLSSWFKNEVIESPFAMKNGAKVWEFASLEPKFSEHFNKCMESDSRFINRLLVSDNKFEGLFEGVESFVDVGGGIGTTTKAISEAFPWLKTCIVLDQPHVVEGLQNIGNVNFVGGDMFDMIPQADAVLLKWILHDWSDDNCIKILKKCKEALSRKQASKVIIIDMVLKPEIERSTHSNPDLLMDILLMSVYGEGKERNEEEWKKLFDKSGFGNYKILPILGLRSVIELYLS